MLSFSKMIMSVTLMAASMFMAETLNALALQACGDGTCAGGPGETPCNCPVDCGPPDPDEQGAACFDGIDNDCNGLTDCADPENCAGLP